MITIVTAIRDEDAIRAAAISWIRNATFDGTIPVTRAQLEQDFRVDGAPFKLVDKGRGIRKPQGWRAPLTIMTSYDSPYVDAVGADGLQRYKMRRDSRGSSENHALRVAMEEGVPLIWLVGVVPGVFNAIPSALLLAEEREEDQFVLALSDEQCAIDVGSPVEAQLRKYMLAETKRRLHQPLFASQVMLAYETRCAVCRLGHRELLDAAHIIGDTKPRGEPVVPNGLALCKIHHAAFDRNILGIRPDYVVEVHHRLLDEIDGPMLRHGLQDHHNKTLLQVPVRRSLKPDPVRLEQRYEEFRAP